MASNARITCNHCASRHPPSRRTIARELNKGEKMAQNTLESTMADISAIWGPLTTELVDAARSHIEALAKTSPEEPWLTELRREQPVSRELYRDPKHGFVLL